MFTFLFVIFIHLQSIINLILLACYNFKVALLQKGTLLIASKTYSHGKVYNHYIRATVNLV